MYSLLGNPSVKYQEHAMRSKKYAIIFVIAVLILIYYLFGLTDTVFKKQVVRNPVVSSYSDNSWGNDNSYNQKQDNRNEQKFKQRTNTNKPATNPPGRRNSVLLTKDVLSDPMVRKIVPYTLGRNDIRYVEWENSCVLPPDITENYNHFSKLVCSGSNAIDIGAQGGDTTVAIAAATKGGITYAYEPHPKAFHLLYLQHKLNPQLRLNPFNIALMKDTQDEMYWNGVGDGCNGGIQSTSCGQTSPQCIKIKSEDVATNFKNLPNEFVKKLSLIKVDTEGNDRYILRGLKDSILKVIRPLIKIEWFAFFKNCNADAKDMFHAIEEIDYIPYALNHEITLKDLKVATCDNWSPDLLLFPREWNMKEKGIHICPEPSDVANSSKKTIKQKTSINQVDDNLVSLKTEMVSNKDVLEDPMVRKIVPYKLGKKDIRYVEWENGCVLPPNITEEYNHFSRLVCNGSNAIDIGAQAGDTTVGIAAATHGGVTYAYEPHPKAFHILHLQQKLNPVLRLKSFNIALMKDLKNEMWWNGVGDGCNGGIQTTSCGGTSKECIKIKSEDVATNFKKLPIEFVKQLSFIKIDTEGNDRYVLRGLKGSILEVVRPLIKIEWYTFFKNCNSNANDMFRAIEEIDYIPYGFNYGIALEDLKIATCDNYFPDLILVPREWNTKEKGIKICPEVVHRK